MKLHSEAKSVILYNSYPDVYSY